MNPLQIWLPQLNSTLSNPARSRDAERAFQMWNGETAIWLLPDLPEPKRWTEDKGRRVLAIPAEHLDRIDVYHRGKNGHIVGYGAASRFPKSRVDGLLEAWLDEDLMGAIAVYPAPQSVNFAVPRISEKGADFEEISLPVHPYGLLPISEIEESTRKVRANWPPEGTNFPTISPDAESEARYGPIRRIDKDGVPVGVSSQSGHRSLHLFARWPEPAGELIPAADGVDVFLHRRQMTEIALQSAQDPQGAMLRASQLAQSYVFHGHSSLMWTWFWPTALGDKDETVVFQAHDLNFSAESVSELVNRPSFREAMSKKIPIRRAWGPVGLFWALLLERLEDKRPLRICENCQRPLVGKSTKRYCGATDNPKCFAARERLYQSKSRERRA